MSIDPEKQKALDAVEQKRPYHVKGVLCKTVEDVLKAWDEDPIVKAHAPKPTQTDAPAEHPAE